MLAVSKEIVLLIWYLMTVLAVIVLVIKELLPFVQALAFLRDVLLAIMNIGECESQLDLIYFKCTMY